METLIIEVESQNDLFPMNHAPRNASMIHFSRPIPSIYMLLPEL